MSNNPQFRQGDAVAFFQRHVVPIQFAFRRGQETQYRIISAFVLSVRDNWYLVTAGHCLDDVRKNVEGGWKVANVWLLDSLGVGARYLDAIPFAWGDDMAGRVFEDPDDDFGLILLDSLTRKNLEANQIVPLTEEVWDRQPDQPEAYLLIGVPSELARPAEPVSTLASVMLRIDAAAERPPELNETAAERWYGYVRLPERGLSDIDGMSGGPIFSLRTDADGRRKYWLHALQSAWHRPTRAVAACPTRYLGKSILDVLSGGALERGD